MGGGGGGSAYFTFTSYFILLELEYLNTRRFYLSMVTASGGKRVNCKSLLNLICDLSPHSLEKRFSLFCLMCYPAFLVQLN